MHHVVSAQMFWWVLPSECSTLINVQLHGKKRESLRELAPQMTFTQASILFVRTASNLSTDQTQLP